MSTPSPRKHAPKQPRSRPPLPTEHANPLLDGKHKNSVRTQTLNLENGMFIDIARVKLPTPRNVPNHIIKRFDTGALSASTMFRVAYPTSSTQAERAELAWISENYDTHAPGHGDNPAAKLTGIWVFIDVAKKLASDYGLEGYVEDLFSFEVEKKLRSPSPAATRVSKRQRLTSHSPAPESQSSSIAARTSPYSSKSPKHVSKDIDGKEKQNNKAVDESATATSKKTVDTGAVNKTSPKKVTITPSPSGSESSPNRSMDAANTSNSATRKALLNMASEIKGVPLKSSDATTNGDEKEQFKLVTDDVESELAKGKELAERAKESQTHMKKGESNDEPSTTATIKRRRSIVESDKEDDDESDEATLSFWQRTLGRRRRNNNNYKTKSRSTDHATSENNGDDADIQEPRQISPLRRQLAAFAGVVLVGAATAVTPYLLS